MRSRGGLVFKAHRLLYHSTLGLKVVKKKKVRWEHSESMQVIEGQNELLVEVRERQRDRETETERQRDRARE